MQKLGKAKKITKATFKAFIKRNRNNLFVNEKSSFDGMIDGLACKKRGWEKADVNLDKLKGDHEIIRGVWLVGSSRDYFELYEDEQYYGIELYNSCGRSLVAVKK